MKPAAIVLVVFVLSFLSFAYAQSPDATITGRVLDSSNAALANARIEIISLATGIHRTNQTDKEGAFTVSSLPPGPYRIEVAKDGFKTVIREDVVLRVQDIVALNFTLPIGSVTESITVQGGAPIVNTQDASVSTVVNRQFVENIPLNGRSFQSLIMLTPGVAVVPQTNVTNTTGQFSVNGQRATANSFSVDGVSANFGAAPGSLGATNTSGNLPGLTTFGTTQSLVSVDDLQEFRVQTSTYAAEFGRQPGGQISIATRSGSNQLHGSAFDYLRNDVFDANDWFADRAGQPKAAERQNDFGGTLGGPVLIPGLYNGHDKTFFFFSYEGLRLRVPQFKLTDVPSLALRQQAPVGMQPILNAFPLPNGEDLGNGLAQFSARYSDPSSLDATSIRIDHTFSRRLFLFGRYHRAPSESEPRLANNLSLMQVSRLIAQTMTVGATMVFSSRANNDIRANYSGNGAYSKSLSDSFGGAAPASRSALIPSQYDVGPAQANLLLSFPGVPGTLAPQLLATGSIVTTQRQLNFVDNFSYAAGAHQLKFGVDYRRLTPTASQVSYSILTLFTSEQQAIAAKALLGLIQNNIPQKPVFLNFSAYGQDTWHVLHRLTLSFGVRWDVNPAPSEANGNNPLAVNEIDNLATMQLAPLGTKEWRTTYSNFAPRLGVAYQLSQKSGWETVLRGGFGVFYDAGNDFGAQNFALRYPYSSSQTVFGVDYPLSSTQVAPAPVPISTGLTPPYGTFVAFDPGLKLPYTLQWNAALEHAFGKNQAVTLSYVGAAGRNLLQLTQQRLGNINSKFTTVNLTRNSATSDYDALQVQFQKQLTRGLQALVSYTWSHALDEDSASNTGVVPKRGNADFDIRHVLAAAATYDIPAPSANQPIRSALGHWSFDMTFHVQSALPVDIVGTQFVNPVDGSLVNVRPNVNPGVPFYLSGESCTASNAGLPCPGGRRINPAAFNTDIPANQSGNFGRNQVRGLGGWQTDFAVRREFNLMDRFRLQFRAESFNLFNHPNFGTIQTTLTAPNFGQATNMLNRQLGGISQLYQIGGPRSLQFALKVLF